jgi:hypothetical protein
MAPVSGFADPRNFDEASVPPRVAQWHALAQASLDAETSSVSASADESLRRALTEALRTQPDTVELAVEHAPSPFVARHLWRLVDSIWRSDITEDALAVTAFAIPLLLVTGLARGLNDVTLPVVMSQPDAAVSVLRAGAALKGNQTFALSPALVPPSALAISAWLAWQQLRSLPGRTPSMEALFGPSPIHVIGGSESVHLRFLIGSALAGRDTDLLADRSVKTWGAELTRELIRQLGADDISLLPLPRAPQSPLPARHEGLVAQREVGAQLFASNAIRNLRASTGEPSAVISSHRAADAPGGGELRLSLSSPFDARDAEGFRCPVYPIEPVTTPLRMLLDLLHDCRVTDVRLLGGVHPDSLVGTNVPLFYKPETIPEGSLLQ